MNKQGAIGALLHIYKQAIADLKKIIENIPDSALIIITDPDTKDDNCRSVQTILSHVVHSGYGYATSIHNSKGTPVKRPDKTVRFTTKEYLEDLDSIFNYTENVFNQLNDADLEQLNDSLKIKTSWGQLYDIEQLTEHAIVHILRHKWQIEKMKHAL